MNFWKLKKQMQENMISNFPTIETPEPPQKIEVVDLMEVVRSASNLPANQSLETLNEQERRAQKLKKLGLLAVAEPILAPLEGVRKASQRMGRKIISIPEKNILAFLDRLLPDGGTQPEDLGFYRSNYTSVIWSTSRIRTYQVIEWKEVKIADYPGVPPNDVLDKLEEAQNKQAFDYYTIASVETKVVDIKDPLLFGRYEGDTNRYFLAQWGSDVSLDDVI